MNASVVDLFCGVGGLSHGFYLEGFNVVAGIDIDEACKFAFESNNNAKFIGRSVADLTADEINDLYPEGDIRILVGCAPCQPFSTYTQPVDKQRRLNKGNRNTDDRWKLLNKFAEIIEKIQPDIVSMENVPQLVGNRGGKIYDNFVKTLEKNGYHVFSKIVFCPDYGIPQGRKRFVLLASKSKIISLISPTHKPEEYKTVREAIGHLSPIRAGASSRVDNLHRASSLTEINLKRIKKSKAGGTWRDWDKKMRLDCHKKKTGKTYPAVYGRMEWDSPSPTITTQFYGFGNGRFGHPTQNRAITIREAALLQTFPSTYKFLEPDKKVTFKKLGQFIGNAVPVVLGQTIAKSIKIHLSN